MQHLFPQADAPHRDSFTGRQPHHAAIVAIVRELDAHGRESDDELPSRDVLADAALRISAAAHSSGLEIEHVLIAVKEGWRSAPGRMARRQGANDAALDQLISVCIREFFRTR
jgi:hypothetical protein